MSQNGSTNLDTIDPTFKEDLEASKEVVSAAARWLCDMGYPVVIEPTFVRDNPENRLKYSDNGDLKIQQTVEVKHRPEIPFTSGDDFPYKTIIVDTVHSWARKTPKPHAYLIFNSDLSVVCIIKGETRRHWIQTRKWDNHCNRERSFFECPINKCLFIEVQSKKRR